MDPKRHIVCPHCDAVNAVPVNRSPDAAKCGKCHGKLFLGEPVALDDARLQRQIARSDVPVIVDFWAAWCGPCRAMAPTFERAARELEPNARFVKVNVDENPAAAQRYGVQGIPALFMFRDGKIAARQAGVTDLRTLRSWVEGAAAGA